MAGFDAHESGRSFTYSGRFLTRCHLSWVGTGKDMGKGLQPRGGKLRFRFGSDGVGECAMWADHQQPIEAGEYAVLPSECGEYWVVGRVETDDITHKPVRVVEENQIRPMPGMAHGGRLRFTKVSVVKTKANPQLLECIRKDNVIVM